MFARTDARLAPVAYHEIARGYQLARAIGGVLLVVAGVITTIIEATIASSDVVVAGGVIAAHAITQLRHPANSPFGTLVIDTTLAGVVILFVGQPDLTSGAAALYLFTAALLLLPPRRAAAVVGAGAVWAGLIIAAAPLAAGADQIGTSMTFSATTSIAIMVGTLILVGAVAVTLLGTRSRHETALAAEREAVRLKDEFVSMVSHELRTPLTSIAGFAETLGDGWRSLEATEVDEFLDIIRSETQDLIHLVEDILVIPRIEAGHMPLDIRRFELRALCLAVTEVLRTETDKDVEVSMPAGIMVEADVQRLQQVIRNLVVNAIKYGGDQILIQGTAQGAMLQGVVSDNGPGVPEEDRHRIFERFEQGSSGDNRMADGIGLGLPIARKLMRAMGGDLWFEPRFPTGANFFFSLKTAARAPAEPSLLGS